MRWMIINSKTERMPKLNTIIIRWGIPKNNSPRFGNVLKIFDLHYFGKDVFNNSSSLHDLRERSEKAYEEVLEKIVKEFKVLDRKEKMLATAIQRYQGLRDECNRTTLDIQTNSSNPDILLKLSSLLKSRQKELQRVEKERDKIVEKKNSSEVTCLCHAYIRRRHRLLECISSLSKGPGVYLKPG